MSNTPPNRATSLWVISTYFAQGFPFTVVRILSTVFFTDVGAPDRVLGYLNGLNLPWNLKFLWAPLLDAVSTKRRWMVGLQLAVAALLFLIALMCGLASLSTNTLPYLIAIACVFIVLACIAATNDIAIDAYYLEGLTERADQARYSGYRVMAYRIAMVAVRSGLVALAAFLVWCALPDMGGLATMVADFLYLKSGELYRPWGYTFAVGGLVFFLLALAHGRFLPHFEGTAAVKAQSWQVFAEAFKSYLLQDKIAWMLAFIIFYKIGDELLFSMVTPFLMRELLVSKAQYSWIAGWVGAAGSVLGAMFAAWWIQRASLKRAIWPITIIMNIAIWFYIALAWYKPSAQSDFGLALIAAVHFVEQLAAGLGSGALLIFLLGTCKKEFKAAHYAVGSAIMSIPATVFGMCAGAFREAFGYPALFLSAFLLTLPAMALIPFVPFQSASSERK